MLSVLAVSSGCTVAPPAPAPAQMRTTSPPWDAPRDAIANIEAAGLRPEGLDTTTNQRITQLTVVVDGAPVEIPAWIGVDRLRALQAAAHTHEVGGEIWLEGTEATTVTLGQFFVLWGVQFTAQCLGRHCTELTVTVDGRVVSDPAAVVLATTRQIEVRVESGQTGR